MPVSKLLVEGHLDAELLTSILCGQPLVEQRGSKRTLAPQARQERQRSRVEAAYIRDRDFDFDPPEDLSKPTVDRIHESQALGWRWCRLEMENYLLEPAIVAATLDCSAAAYGKELVGAARCIRSYQAARWVVGKTRRTLPPNHELTTRPDDVTDHEFRLPADLKESSLRTWVVGHVQQFSEKVIPSLAKRRVEELFGEFAARLTEDFVSSPDNVLLWFSGKDLMAALEPWTSKHNLTSAGGFRARLRDWVRNHPEDALEHLPEWRAFVDTLRQRGVRP